MSAHPGSCIGQNPACPCQDGDACHYEDTPTTKGWPVPDDQTGALRQQPEAVDHDRELLKFAAFAVGFTDRLTWTPGVTPWLNCEGGARTWNPLLDDGDALRLAVKLKLNILQGDFSVGVNNEADVDEAALVRNDDERLAVLRHAIVRAAAQIGSELRKTASGSHQEARSNEQGEST